MLASVDAFLFFLSSHRKLIDTKTKRKSLICTVGPPPLLLMWQVCIMMASLHWAFLCLHEGCLTRPVRKPKTKRNSLICTVGPPPPPPYVASVRPASDQLIVADTTSCLPPPSSSSACLQLALSASGQCVIS